MASRKPRQTFAVPPGWNRWLRVIHRGSALIRMLVEDRDVDNDHAREHVRAVKIRNTINQTARVAVGCVASTGQHCDCPLCNEDRAEQR